MEWLDYSRDAFGRKMLIGFNWDLLWVPVAAAALVIAIHLVLRFVRRAG